MITGAHAVLYSSDADALRVFLRDTLGLTGAQVRTADVDDAAGLAAVLDGCDGVIMRAGVATVQVTPVRSAATSKTLTTSPAACPRPVPASKAPRSLTFASKARSTNFPASPA